MQESIFVFDATTIILAILAFIGCAGYRYLLGLKQIDLTKIPYQIKNFFILVSVWNICCAIGTSSLLILDKDEFYLWYKIIFAIQAFAWVQIGKYVYEIAKKSINEDRPRSWDLVYYVGIGTVVMVSILFCIFPDAISNLYIFNFHPAAHYPIFYTYSLIFTLFVTIPLANTGYRLLRQLLYVPLDKDLRQIIIYMLGSFFVFGNLVYIFDIIVPILRITLSNGSEPIQFHYFYWSQFAAFIMAIICSQYYTSVSFKNKSSGWVLQKISQRSSDGIIFYNSEGIITKCNPMASELLRLAEKDLVNRNVQDIFPPEIQFFKEARYNNIKISINFEVHNFKVSIFKNRASLTSTINVILFTDLTNTLYYQQRIKNLNEQHLEYKQSFISYQERLDTANKMVSENENFFFTLMSGLPFRFWAKNEQGVYLKQNREDIEKRGNMLLMSDAKKEMSKYEMLAREQGLSQDFLTYEDEDGNEISIEEANRKINENKPISIFQNMFFPIISGNAPYKIMGMKIDQTTQKLLERERESLKEQRFIHSRLEELGTMCGAFAHDYNNILGAQLMGCQVALELLPKDVKPYDTVANLVEQVRIATERGKESLEQLLNALRQKTEVTTAATNFSAYMVVEDVAKRIYITLPSNIHLTYDNLDESLKIYGMVASLDRIISNMAKNAIDAMKKKGGTLKIELVKETVHEQIVSRFSQTIPPGVYAKIVIADTGEGMDSTTLERIFSPFFTTKAPGEGLGLGLSSALRLLNDAKAYFTVQTTLGEGTIFNIYWPISNDKPEEKWPQS
ncbi:MAG: PAS domain-containing protein [Fibrobacteraceae bacterium]|nr:PAS domain-containing protein [Fibrobacteraceae bacterium]